ncbi:hypothetical protein SEA_MISCHIEF19_60 [Streptomyces phage Mischief19]|nr:hypothetical protein SEA_MISCHIEF19_60 [Streptomyces phage Mischief19]
MSYEQRGNRFDSIRAHALDAAVLLGAGEATRDKVADALIKLCGEIVDGAAKHLAINGETEMNEVHDWSFELDTESIEYSDEEVAERKAEFEAEQNVEGAKAHNRYLAGEALMHGAQETIKEALDADLARWGDRPVWTPPELPAAAPVLRRGRASGTLTMLAHLAADAVTSNGSRDDVRPRPFVGAHSGTVRQPHIWVTGPGNSDVSCTLCHEGGCAWLPGDAIPACDHDVDCPVHGDAIARQCPGERLQQPVVARVAPDAVRRSVHGNATAEDVAAGRCKCPKCKADRARNGL